MKLIGTMLLMTAVVALAIGPLGAGDKDEHGFVSKVYKGKEGESKYVVFVPHDYKGDKDYPLILFLHGAGERGTDGKKQAMVGLGKAIKDKKEKFPFIVVFPQAQKTWQAGSPDGKRALGILDEVQKDYKVDPKRIYLTGLSMAATARGAWPRPCRRAGRPSSRSAAAAIRPTPKKSRTSRAGVSTATPTRRSTCRSRAT